MHGGIHACWCGETRLAAWGGGYFLCPQCTTLCDASSIAKEQSDGEKCTELLYNEDYWLEKMLGLYKNMGHQTIEDVIIYHYRERAAFWVQHFLCYVRPKSSVLEIGCGLGTFCHWLKHLGYDVQGTELNAVWRKILQDKLGILVTDYAVSTEKKCAGRFDAIVLLDVVEHLRAPLAMFSGIANELKQSGIIMIQMPKYDGCSTYAELKEKDHSFLRYLIPDEHIYLYSENSVKKMLSMFGFNYIEMRPSIFPDDMFLFASRAPLLRLDGKEVEKGIVNPESIAAYAALKNWEHARELATPRPSLLGRVKRKLRKVVDTLSGKKW